MFVNEEQRREHTDELDRLIENLTRQREAGVPAGIPLDSAHLRDAPQTCQRGHFWDVEDPEARYFTHGSSSYSLSDPPARFWCTASSLGEATGYVYTELVGLSHGEFARLVEEGVIE
jgi:crotonobetainyl-CoA:carnitine CoA-transferase CaiB-like acyl-CoA transferase